jgi:hypothetical protein
MFSWPGSQCEPHVLSAPITALRLGEAAWLGFRLTWFKSRLYY